MFNSSLTHSLSPERQFLSSWIEDVVLPSEAGHTAYNILVELSELLPQVALLRVTPQTPPYHAEGGRVEDHLLRMTAVLLTVSKSGELGFLEELARNKLFSLEVKSLAKILVEHQAFFLTYIFAHDLAKSATLFFDCPAGSVGEGEGFRQSLARAERLATQPEKERYDKWFRAFGAEHPELFGQDLVTAFFKFTGITASYTGHDRAAAQDNYLEVRNKISSFFKLPTSHAKLLREVIRLHLDFLHAFNKGPDAKAYEAFAAIALKAGLPKDLFLDVISGILFLDNVVGSLMYEHGETFYSLKPLFNYWTAEREAAPIRHAEREAEAARAVKTLVKELLVAGGLDPQTVFTLLETPIGPIRGKVQEQIYFLLADPEAIVDFGPKTAELRERARKTRQLFKEHNLSPHF